MKYRQEPEDLGKMKKHFKTGLFLAALAIAMPVVSRAQVVVAIRVAPPVIPVIAVEDMPIAPAPGYLWTPGYWAYGPAGYYWVPGIWVQPPAVGLLWTPGYWGFVNGVYGWNAGYWGPHVGFYGGVNYGFGYTGVGFLGGVWAGGLFRYNTAVLRVGPGFHDVYVNRAAIVAGGPRYSFNGPGGWSSRPTAGERLAERDHHIGRTSMQASHEHTASLDRGNRFSENHGRPEHAGGMGRPGGARPGGAAGRPVAHAAPGGAANRGAAAAHGAPGRAGGGSPAAHNTGGRAPSGGGHAAPASRGGGHAAPAAHGGGAKGGEHHKD